MTKFGCALIFMAVLGLGRINAQGSVTSNFNTGSDSWLYDQGVSTAMGAVTYNATGGNPTGNISITNSSGSTQFYALAPAQFTGNLSAAYNKMLTFDLQQSTAGADNGYGDVILTNSAAGVSLFYQLPTKPAVGTWSPYSVTLNEASWKYGCPTCTTATKDQMKLVLSNLTALRIRLKYLVGSTAPYTGSLDNVALSYATVGAAPTITSITPTSGLPGTTVIISGTNFNTTAAQNAVYFNGVKATVTNATATQLTVKSPAKAPYGPITAINLAMGQQATSTQHFNPLFNNSNDFGGRIIPSSMSIGYKTVLPDAGTYDNRFGNMAVGDLDNDGWTDIVATETGTVTIRAFRNLGTGGTVSASSFAAAITLPAIATFIGANPYLSEISIVDIDSDGKLDIAAAVASNGGQAYFAVYRNTSTAGTLSFANPSFFPFPYYAAGYTAYGDLDGDGRIDLVDASGSSPSAIWVNLNLSTPGNIDFAYGMSIGATSGINDLAIADLNKDGKPEVVAAGYNAAVFTVYQNNSTPGALSFTNFNITTTSVRSQLTIADLDADSKPDLAWGAYGNNYLYLMKNNYSSGVFSAASFGAEVAIPSTVSAIDAVTAGDINADGKPDVVAVGGSDMGIFQNKTIAGTINTSSFSPSVLFEGAQGGESIYASGVSVADLDGDNKPEVIMVYTNNVSTANKAVFIFHNECFPPPVITTLSTQHGAYGSTYTATGNYLNTYGDIPQTRTQGIISGSNNVSNTSVDTSVPLGASSARMGVTLHNLSAFSPLPFSAAFNTARVIDAASFPASVDYALAYAAPPHGLAAGDFDDDGKPDLVTTDNVGGYSVAKIYRNNLSVNGAAITTSTLTSVTNTLNAVLHVETDDLDGDGKIDIVANGLLAQNAGSAITFNGVFSPMSSITRIVTQHDFNNDGKSDLAATTTSNQIAVHENFTRKGPFASYGSFASVTNSPVQISTGGTVTGLTAGDFDGDGWEDIAFGVTAASGNLSVLRNTGMADNITTAQFAAAVTFTASTAPAYITAADLDGDGKLDLAVGNNSNTYVSVYLNKSASGTINFTRQDFPSLTGAVGIEAADLDGDGKAELVLIHQPTFTTGAFSILKNNSTAGNLAFATHVDYTLPGVPVSLEIADLNLDSKPDIIISRNAAPSSTTGMLSIFENKIATPALTIDTQPYPTYLVCNGAKPTFITAASGTTNITYLWQKFDAAAGAYADLSDTGPYTNTATAAMTVNTTGNAGAGQYRCKVGGDAVTSVYTKPVTLTIAPVPAAPTASDVTHCGPGQVTLTATGATTGEQYMWYDSNGLISGQTTGTYTTPPLTATSAYDVALTDGTCVSPRVTINAIIQTGSCSNPPPVNQPPVIKTDDALTTIGGKVQIDLMALISDGDNNLDPASLSIITPPASGATAFIDQRYLLTIDYENLSFAGSDKITIQVCDQDNLCTQQNITIEVNGNIVIYNAVSPNGDGKNDFLFLQYIDVLPDTRNNEVSIYNRWGDEIFSTHNYDNATNLFTGYASDGKRYPAGTYFYKISFTSGHDTVTGFFDIRY